MRNTNRALNRILLALLGIVLLGTGAALIAAGTLPWAADLWTSSISSVRDQARNLVGTAPLPEPVGSWWLIPGLAGPLVLAALGFAWLASQGGGKTPRLAEESEGTAGRTVIDAGLLSTAIREALRGNADVLSTSISAWESRRGTALHIRLEARKGASPRALADTVEQLLRNADDWLGHPMPALVRITSGTRAHLAGSRRAK